MLTCTFKTHREKGSKPADQSGARSVNTTDAGLHGNGVMGGYDPPAAAFWPVYCLPFFRPRPVATTCPSSTSSATSHLQIPQRPGILSQSLSYAAPLSFARVLLLAYMCSRQQHAYTHQRIDPKTCTPTLMRRCKHIGYGVGRAKLNKKKSNLSTRR